MVFTLCRSNLLFKSSDGFGGHTKPVKCLAVPAKNLSSIFFVEIVNVMVKVVPREICSTIIPSLCLPCFHQSKFLVLFVGFCQNLYETAEDKIEHFDR